MDPRSEFGITPEQYHAGLDQLWDALGVTGPQDDDVFTLAAAAIRSRADLLAACKAAVNISELWRIFPPYKPEHEDEAAVLDSLFRQILAAVEKATPTT